ncbi:MAG: hypothetical protein M1832_001428 [Thelocarpon impressellum]|nr:MAG: hypothetical protein M1832_001428 [Thelocarpon impressellum]
MDNEAVFQAETDAEGVASRKARSRTGRGLIEDVAEATSSQASLGRSRRRDSRTPLLERDGDDEDPRGDDGSGWAGAADFEGLPWWRRPSVFWLLPSFLLFTLAFGGIMVPKLNLILTLICRQYLADRTLGEPDFQVLPVVLGADNPQCQTPEVQALVSQFALYNNLITGVLSAVTSPKLGALSDRYGRKKMIAATTLGMLLAEIITIIAATYPDSVSVNWLLVGFFFDGICGSFTAAMALTHSYATDCTPPEKRNVAFGYFHGCLFTGVAAGPIIAGYVIKATDDILTVFYIALVCHFVFILSLVFVIPESLSKRRQMVAREKYKVREDKYERAGWYQTLKGSALLSPLASMIRAVMELFTPLAILFPRGAGSSGAVRANLILLSAVDTIMFGVAMGSMTVVILYSEYMFGWGNLESSVFVSIVNTGRVLMLVIVLPLATKLFRGRRGAASQRSSGSDLFDLSVIRVAVFFDLLGYLGYTLVRTGPLFTLSGLLASIGGVGSPSLQSALTKHVPPDRTGQLLGATGLLHALARVVAPTIFNLIYSATVGKFTQTVFVCLTATFGVGFALTWFIRPHVYLDEPDAPPRGDGVSEALTGEAE